MSIIAAAWPSSSAAWKGASSSVAPAERASEWTLLLRLAMPSVPQRFTFMELAVQRLASNTSETHGLLGQRAFLRPSDGERAAQLSVTPFGRTADHAGFGPQGEGAIEGIVHDYVTEGLQDHVGGRFSRWRCGARGEGGV